MIPIRATLFSMKIPVFNAVLGLILTLSIGAQAAEEDAQAIMRFHNDDHLAGKLKALDDESLVWESEFLAEPATFDLEHVLNLTLDAENNAPEANHLTILTLKNGDQIHGQLCDITDETIAIDTWFADTMKFRRSMVSKILIEGSGNLHYRGPSGIEQWKQVPGECWEYKRQAFISRKAGSIARDQILPEQCSIAFTVERKSDQLDFKLMLFSNDIDSGRPRSGYELSFQNSSVYLRSGKTRNFLGSDHSRDLSQNDKARIEVRASRKTGKVVLLINGRVNEVWNDPGVDRNEFGSGLHFIAGNKQSMRISDIEIGPWEGKVDQVPQPGGIRVRGQIQPAPEPTFEDAEGRMQLANGDSLEGEVSSIEEGLITLKTPLGEIKIPVERLRSLNLDGLDTERAKRERGDIRALFADGSTMVFRFEEVSEDELTGTSQNFGKAIFKLSAIHRIEFDIYNEKVESLRSTSDW